MSRTNQYRGRLGQIGVCFGKLVRIFFFQNDWKALPMAALIAALVTFAAGTDMFYSQEGTFNSCFSFVCVAIWTGSFNSIQVICRERAIIKREHRAGLHISSYIAAHMLWQAILCFMQTCIILAIANIAGIEFPQDGLLTPYSLTDYGLLLFAVMYTADLMALAISAIVRTTTAAMTVMPFVMMFQLLFSNGLIPMEGISDKISKITISRWGLNGMCAIADYNSQPQVSLWNTIWKFRSLEVRGQYPVKELTDYIRNNGHLNDFLVESGKYSTFPDYVHTRENILMCLGVLIVIALICVFVSIAALEFIDHDKR
ncbi:MAG: ABC transporter permease [Solobacterium sp.]|nr:ABC transporter permease [Solobacterium sp.]